MFFFYWGSLSCSRRSRSRPKFRENCAPIKIEKNFFFHFASKTCHASHSEYPKPNTGFLKTKPNTGFLKTKPKIELVAFFEMAMTSKLESFLEILLPMRVSEKTIKIRNL